MAEDWPTKPVRLVVGFPPGGPTDVIARIVAAELGKQLGQPVVVENRGGAGGTVAAVAVAKSKPDGYTLMLTAESVQTRAPAVFRKLAFDPAKDFVAIRKVARQRVLLVANPAQPFSTVRELIAYARANPDKLNYGATHSASSHFGGALFGLLNKVELTAVNYPGGSQPITDAIGGTVQIGFFTESTVAQHIQAGRLKALAVAASDRSTLFPNLPTLKEAGAVDMDASPWFGVVAPAGTPEAVVARVYEALNRFISSPDYLAQLASIGAQPIVDSSPAMFASEIRRDIDYWKDFVVKSKFPQID